MRVFEKYHQEGCKAGKGGGDVDVKLFVKCKNNFTSI